MAAGSASYISVPDDLEDGWSDMVQRNQAMQQSPDDPDGTPYGGTPAASDPLNDDSLAYPDWLSARQAQIGGTAGAPAAAPAQDSAEAQSAAQGDDEGLPLHYDDETGRFTVLGDAQGNPQPFDSSDPAGDDGDDQQDDRGADVDAEGEAADDKGDADDAGTPAPDDPTPSAGEGTDQLAGGTGDDRLGRSKGLESANPAVGAIQQGIDWFFARDANGKPLHPLGHPGFAESMIPVEGAGREGLADLQEGHPLMGAVNLGLAGWELSGLGTVADDALKLGLRFGKSNTWGAVRKAAGKKGLIDFGQPGHHMIHQADIPDWVPDMVANNWLNIVPMKDRIVEGVEHTGSQVHRRLHGRANVDDVMMPEFNAFQKLRYGTKSSTRAIIGGLPEAGVRATVDRIMDGSDSDDSPR